MAAIETLEPQRKRIDPSALPWLAVILLAAIAFLMRGDVSWLKKYPRP